MTFDYALSVQDEKVVVTSQAIGGLKLRSGQVNATVGDDEEQLEESLAVLFSKMGSPALLSIRSKVESLVDTALTTYLKKIKSDTNYVPKNQYDYKVKTTPTKVGVYEDNVLTVSLKTELYKWSTLLTSTSERYFKMSYSNSSLMQYNVDENIIAVAVNEFVNKQSTSVKKYDNKDFGKVFESVYGDNSYNVMQEIFQVDSSDYEAKDNQYKIGVQLVKDSAKTSVDNSTVQFSTDISLLDPKGYALHQSRKFVVDLVATMIPVMEGSVVTATVKNLKASGIRLLGDSEQEIELTASQKSQYMTYCQMFLQMKKTSISKHLKDLQMEYDLATFDPLESLHATVTGKTYTLQVAEGAFNFDISSDQFPAPKQEKRKIKPYEYYTITMDKFERDSTRLVDGVNNKSETVIAQVDQDETNYFWVAPKQSLDSMVSYDKSQVTMFKKQ